MSATTLSIREQQVAVLDAEAIARETRKIREGWSKDEHARRRRVAYTMQNQLGLLMDLSAADLPKAG